MRGLVTLWPLESTWNRSEEVAITSIGYIRSIWTGWFEWKIWNIRQCWGIYDSIQWHHFTTVRIWNGAGYVLRNEFVSRHTIDLYSEHELLGRSIVIHKREHNLRWACSTLERGYSPQEAREIRAIASFHHPYGYAYGYIRFTQLIHNDGSKSDTVIEVKLQHPGENDRNIVCRHFDRLW